MHRLFCSRPESLLRVESTTLLECLNGVLQMGFLKFGLKGGWRWVGERLGRGWEGLERGLVKGWGGVGEGLERGLVSGWRGGW